MVDVGFIRRFALAGVLDGELRVVIEALMQMFLLAALPVALPTLGIAQKRRLEVRRLFVAILSIVNSPFFGIRRQCVPEFYTRIGNSGLSFSFEGNTQ